MHPRAREYGVLGNLLRRAAERYGDRVFLEFAEGSRPFNEQHRASKRVANGLAELGVGPGAKVAIMALNSLAFVDAWFEAACAGAVYVPINTDYKGDILAYQLAHADVTHIVIDVQFLERLDAVLGQLPKLRHIVLTTPLSEFAQASHEDIERSTLAEVMRASDRDPGIHPAPCDPLAISFTSGTTGRSKGVLASHAHVITFARDWIRSTDFIEGQAIYTCMPLFHAIASWLGVIPALINGGRIAVAQRFLGVRFLA